MTILPERSRMRMRVWCLLLLSTSLSACVSQPVQQAQEPAARQAALQALDDFGFRGGLSVQSDNKSVSARIVWQQTGQQLQINLSGPLGIGRALLVARPGLATLSRSGRPVAEGPVADQVLQQGLGLAAPVPVRQLQQWVKGSPGKAESIETDAEGKLSSLEYTDELGTRWEARFLRYSNLDGLLVPSLITALGGEYSLRLVLKDWHRGEANSVTEKEQSNTRLVIPSP